MHCTFPRNPSRSRAAGSFKSKMPLLNALTKAIAALDSALLHFPLDAPSRQSRDLFTAPPSKQLAASAVGRQFVRDELLHMRRVSIAAALACENRAQNEALKDPSPEEKHATLLLLLLQLKDGFAKPHVDKAKLLETAGSKHLMYIVHAALVCSAAIKTWTPEVLHKFLIGDLGAGCVHARVQVHCVCARVSASCVCAC